MPLYSSFLAFHVSRNLKIAMNPTKSTKLSTTSIRSSLFHYIWKVFESMWLEIDHQVNGSWNFFTFNFKLKMAPFLCYLYALIPSLRSARVLSCFEFKRKLFSFLGDKLVAHASKNQRYRTPQNVNVTLRYPPSGFGNFIITYVKITVNQTSDAGNAYFSSGGINQHFVEILVQSFNTYQMDYSTLVYGK